MNLVDKNLFISFTIAQKALIQCCLTENKEQFLTTWRIWKKEQNFEELDPQSIQLIPTLVKQIDHFQIEDENTPRYRGIIKKNWVKNQKQQVLFTEIQKYLNNKSYFIQHIQNNNLHILRGLIKQEEKNAIINLLLHLNFKLSKSKNQFYSKLKRQNFIELINTNNEKIQFYWCLTRIPHTKKFHQESLNLSPTFSFYLTLLNSSVNSYSHTFAWIVESVYYLKNEEIQIDWVKFKQLVQENESSEIILPAINALSLLEIEPNLSKIIEQIQKNKSISLINKLESILLLSNKKWMRYLYYLLIYPIKSKKLNK